MTTVYGTVFSFELAATVEPGEYGFGRPITVVMVQWRCAVRSR